MKWKPNRQRSEWRRADVMCEFVHPGPPPSLTWSFGDFTHTTNMQALKWIVLALVLSQGGWLMFDGGRALITGDYVTPSSGPRAGQLGPWSRIVSAVGLEPRSTFMSIIVLVLLLTPQLRSLL